MKQWYEIETELLEVEKIAMSNTFPHFKLETLDDGRLYWIGDITPGIYETKFNERLSYRIMVVYNNNHSVNSQQENTSSTVRVYPILPDVDELINRIGFKHQLFRIDSANHLYLDVGNGLASSVIYRVSSWLVSYELVLIGKINKDLFKDLSSLG